MIFKQLFLKFDFLGKTQNFTIAKKNTYQTYIGSFLSLTIVIILVYFVLYFGLVIINKEKPNLITTVYNIDDPPYTPINETSFVMTIALENPDYSVYIDDSIYTLNVFFMSNFKYENGTQKTIRKKIDVIKCSEYKFKVLYDYFEHQDLDNLYCLNTTEQLFIKGEYGKEEWTFINYEFSRCVNTSENNNKCKSAQEIDDKLTGGFLGIFMTDLSIIPSDYKNPSNIYGKNLFSSFQKDFLTDVWFYMKTIEVNTDSGLLIQKMNKETYLAYDSHFTTSDYRKDEVFLNLHFRLSQTTEIYDRTYDKLQAIAAELGGIMKFCLVCGEMIVYFFREVLYRDYILTFFFEEPSKDKQLKEKSVLSNHSNVCSVFVNSPSPNKKLDAKENNNNTNNYLVSPCSSQIKMKNSNSKIDLTENIKSPLRATNTKKMLAHRTTLNSCLLLGPCLFDSRIRKNIKSINEKYHRIAFLFDVVHYLKSKDELNSVKKVIFDDIQNKLITKSYSFKLNPQEEKKQFDFSVNFPKKAKSNNLINQANNFKSASKTTVNPKLKKQATFL